MLYSNTPAGMRSMQQNCGCGRTQDNPVRANCKCGCQDTCIDQYPLAMAYVPWQEFGEVYPLERGFQAGTIFPCLDLPFLCASQACNRRGGRV